MSFLKLSFHDRSQRLIRKISWLLWTLFLLRSTKELLHGFVLPFSTDDCTIIVDYNDENFIRLGQSLSNNTQVKILKMWDMNMERITAPSTTSLAQAICRSHCAVAELHGIHRRQDEMHLPMTIIPKELYGGLCQSKAVHSLEIHHAMVDAPTLSSMLASASSELLTPTI